MSEDVKSLLDRVCGLISRRADREGLAQAKRRHAAVLAWQEPDYLPVVLFGDVPETEGLPDFDWAQQWHDPATSLYMQLKGVLRQLRGDSVPGVRADTGVINCMTMFGAAYTVPAHTRPVITGYVPKETLREFQVPADVSNLGVMPRVIEHMEHHKAVLKAQGISDVVGLYHCDQQGPWDIAAQTRGHDLFTDLYEDGDFVHQLMAKTADAYIAVTRLCKRINGEPVDGGSNAVGYWMTNGGVRMCGDSDILISLAQHREFVQPYQQRAFQAFGGGWLHYCGGARGFGRMEGLHLHDSYAEIDGLRGLNWTTAGDWYGQMRKLRDLGVVHLGGAPREKGQSLEQYFRGVLELYGRKNGVILTANVRKEELDGAMAQWHRAQDQMFH